MPAPPHEPGTIHHQQTGTETALDAVWNVVVHNDPINLMSYVTHVFQRVFGYSRQRAEHLMMEVHTRGRSLVWSGDRELAELHVHQLHGYQLHATIERASL